MAVDRRPGINDPDDAVLTPGGSLIPMVGATFWINDPSGAELPPWGSMIQTVTRSGYSSP